MSTASPGKWGDLAARSLSAVIMVLFGFTAIWQGGDVFHVAVAAICGVMMWELVQMVHPDKTNLSLILGGVAAAALFVASYVPLLTATPFLIVPALAGALLLPRYKRVFALFAAAALVAGYAMVAVRDHLGLDWMIWLVLVVVATDIMGYFAGRVIGGPKFWPRISPKKTWSGTIGGWIGAAVVGWCFATISGAPMGIIWFSVLIAVASQFGDISESAIKRAVGVKDSSRLIPGHGGVLDRFDGMMGASLLVLATGLLFRFPPELV